MRVICRDAEWLVTRVETINSSRDKALYCVGADDFTRGCEAVFLTPLDEIKPVDPRETRLARDESGGYAMAKLFLEAQLRQMPLTDPEPHVEGMGAFKAMPFQVEAVRRAIAQLRPRLLLADAVGLGKTIEVGMILCELMKRGRADRILVLAKKSMLAQFQGELWNRFAIPLVRMDSRGLARLQLKIPASKNPFEVYPRIIISMDTLKDVGRYAHFLENTRWDVVVIDEAHNVAGGANPERHLSFRLARRLSRRADSMILTTATPHNGKRETFGRLISLLDPSAIPDPALREYDAHDVKPFFLMRFKEDVREEAGEHFASRVVTPLEETTIDATPGEEAVYKMLAGLREAALNKTIASSAIVQWGMYKSFLSSPGACLSTAEKRLRRQRGAGASSQEADLLQPLVEALGRLDITGSARFRLLLEQLETLGWNGGKKSPRLLLFTESRVTQEHLGKALARHFKLKYSPRPEDQPNQVLSVIHGGMPDVVLAEAVESFGVGGSRTRMLLATDVASEGVNLHHQCHHIIHYDLPWSIITLIQRNGRIDRFGQKNSPRIRYLMVKTRQGILEGDADIFQRLVEKVEEINRSTRSGESVLQLYDPEKEEEYIAREGVLAGNQEIFDRAAGVSAESGVLDHILREASQQGPDDPLAFLKPGASPAHPEAAGPDAAESDNSRIRLMSDEKFFTRGWKTLRQAADSREYKDLHQSGRLIIFDPPEELRRRLGASDVGGDVIHGAAAIPEESWPEDGRLRFSADPRRIERAIEAALAGKGQWAEELPLTEQHPAARWLAERLMMLMKRGEAPLIASPHLENGALL
ncbi:MAG: DEAD/DEAH box helicase, partial [Desulfobacterales bacterium]|nr:DEAD/DEAH box helicase [Desulfobacterales bacterium]